MKIPLHLVNLADRDYITARLVNFCGHSLRFQAAYHAQQCIEKYLKAILLQETSEFPEVHKLDELRSLCVKVDKIFSEKAFVELIRKFDLPEQVARYGMFASYDPLAKKETGKFEAKGVIIWGDDDIKDLDKLAYKIRGFVDFSGNEQSDGLRSILNEDDKHQLTKGWKLKFFSIKDVLASHNDYFRQD